MKEPDGLISGKIQKIEPHVPYYMADGNKVIRKWKENFVDRLGNAAILTKVEFLTKKGKLNEAVIQVQWYDGPLESLGYEFSKILDENFWEIVLK